jgi:hypothetical protein
MRYDPVYLYSLSNNNLSGSRQIMKLTEIICLLNGISLIAMIFIRTPLKMARIETNTNQTLDNAIILFTVVYIVIVLVLKT